MKTQKVLSNKMLPVNLPIYQTLTTGIALDYWNAPEWLWGALILFFIIIWVLVINRIFTEEKIDFLNEDNDKKRKSFKEKLKDKINEKQ